MALFNRSIDISAAEEGNDIRIEGSLRDERLGEELHGLEVSMLVSVMDGEIKHIEGSMPEVPMEECERALPVLQEIRGVRIRPGFTDLVRERVSSRRGCTHLASLLINMGNASVQGRGAFMRKHVPDEQAGRGMIQNVARDLGLIDSCVCWTEDGPIMQRWREQEERGRGS